MDSHAAKEQYARAQRLFKAGQFAEALALTDELYQAFPNEPNILFARARCLVALGRLDEARPICANLKDIFGHRRAAELLAHIDAKQAPAMSAFDVPERTTPQKPQAPVSRGGGKKKVAAVVAAAAVLAIAAAGFLLRGGDSEESKVAAAVPVPMPVPDRPTYYKDVAPIMLTNCVVCHRPGEAVPMSLVTYEQTRPWAKQIVKMVSSRTMPPWHADPSVGEWANDRRLSDHDLETIVRWAQQGAQRGNPADGPEIPTFTTGWKIGEPDMVFTASTQMLPAELEDEYRYIYVPTGFTEDRWVSAAEIRPGNMDVVHHVILFTADPKKGQSGLDGSLGGYAPGSPPIVLDNGRALKIAAGTVLVFQIHYHKEPGQREEDQTRVGIKFAKGTVRKQLRFGTVGTESFVIPARDAFYPVQAELRVDQDIHVEQIIPHMHLRGKDMKVWARYPDGSRADLIVVPNYDFNWQTFYKAAEPIAVPKGTELHAYAHFDNSTDNPFNPDPNADVRWGEPTTAEMMYAFFTYTVDDEKLKARDPGT